MKLIVALITLGLSVTAQAYEQDKVLHVTTSALVMAVLAKAGVDPIPSLVITGALGVAKEIYDPVFDKQDIRANSIGMGLGLVFHF